MSIEEIDRIYNMIISTDPEMQDLGLVLIENDPNLGYFHIYNDSKSTNISVANHVLCTKSYELGCNYKVNINDIK